MNICRQVKALSPEGIVVGGMVKALSLVCITVQGVSSAQRWILAMTVPVIRQGLQLKMVSIVVAFLLCANGATLYWDSQKKEVQLYQPTSIKTNVAKAIPSQASSDAITAVQTVLNEQNGADVLQVAQPLSTHALITQLKEFGLWDLSGKKEVVPMLVPGFPVNLQHLDVASKKKAFFHTLLPVARIALREVEHERQQLLTIAGKLPVGTHLGDADSGWKLALSDDEHLFLVELAQKYRSSEIDELIRRVDGLPVSLILAQGAIESSWGTSRFAVHGKNLFGVWTWGEEGMVPNERVAGKTHKVAIYDSILDSVKAYILTLNRHSAYDDLRSIRQQTTDPVQLADGLISYSERGNEYISDVQMMIDYNKLQRFDVLQLARQAAGDSLNS